MKEFLMFKEKVELITEKKIKILQTDGREEYNSFMTFLEAHGITRQISCPFISE